MKLDSYKCDNCGLVENVPTHWFRADRIGRDGGIQVHALDEMISTDTTIDLCSDSCVIKTVQKWLDAKANTAHHDDRIVRAIVDSVDVR